MDTASFSGLIRNLIIIILAYYALKYIMRLLAPVIVQQVVKKASENMYQRQQDNFNQQQAKQEPQKQAPAEKKKVGEYIDFEEID
ncbi:DUF4834 domain-containing protein [Flavobacterium zepuense]|uniref:DUF4834 domain-containing protein n=1 Tax=Flavobacterium zepuense TaxID=2593302 RepID=A0A552VA32_9FLAO|nr:DUF4834 domain-containing protein [Flavobacterium zepuense]TRW27334.1 DUF4834 domain-containing protein [Flavobacterium zepuense]